MRLSCLLSAYIFVGLPWTLTLAQRDPVPSFRAQSELVLVDLVVTDKQGNFVRNLRPDQIRVFEDGKRQRISYFDLRRRAGPDDPLGEEVARRQRRAAIPFSSDFDRSVPAARVDQGHFVFLLDMPSLSFDGMQRVKQSIRDFARSQFNPKDRFMLATIRPSFRLDLPFTTNIAELERVLEQTSDQYNESQSIAGFTVVVEEIFGRLENVVRLGAAIAGGGAGSDGLDPNLKGAISRVASEGRQLLAGLEMRTDFSCAAIAAVSRHLRTLPGRKHLIYFSNGYPLDAARTIAGIIKQRAMDFAPGQVTGIHLAVSSFMAGTGRSSDLRSKLMAAVDQANRSRVSIYSIDPRGLMVPAIADASVKGSVSYIYNSVSTEDITAPRQFLSSLSLETGGLWFADDNDLGHGMRKAYKDSREHYLLGYVPSSPRKVGKFHEIKVKVKRKGLKLRYRTGYTEEDPIEATTVDLANAFKFPDLFRDFPVDTVVSQREGKLKVEARIPTEAFSFSSEGEQHRCVVEMFGALLDGSGKWVGEDLLFAKRIELDFSQQELENFHRYKGFVPVAEQDAPEGAHDLVVVVRQIPSGQMATSTHKIAFEFEGDDD